VSLPSGSRFPGVSGVCLVVMDGWGIAPAGPGNAITLARTPVLDELRSDYPVAALSASGRSVGLPEGQMGNSEVGHLTLGAGAAVPQTLTLIDDAVAAGDLARNQVVCHALTAAHRVHLVGMVSEGGVPTNSVPRRGAAMDSDDVQPPPVLADLDRDECLERLGQGTIGRVVVTIGAEAWPLIRPVNYVFDTVSQSVVFRSAAGSKLYALLHSTRACFEVDAIDVDHRSGWSVIIEGVTELVTDVVELRRLERLGLQTWVTDPDSRWIRIRARMVSGRRIGAPRPV
jgi:nitroimidazol reductase NimA-like FMN-containing flavoprotein (pyridoxamine 5'-phosphate oxidase superfamily)